MFSRARRQKFLWNKIYAVLFAVHNVLIGPPLNFAVNPSKIWENWNQYYRDNTPVPTEERKEGRITRKVGIIQQD